MTVLSFAPPPATGRHRNRALADARRARAIELRLTGHTYQQIADELGYANKGTVHRLITNALRAEEAETTRDLRALETDRLDALQAAHWDAALNGDVGSARLVLAIIDKRAKLHGLYPQRTTTKHQPDDDVTLYDFDEHGRLVPVEDLPITRPHS